MIGYSGAGSGAGRARGGLRGIIRLKWDGVARLGLSIAKALSAWQWYSLTLTYAPSPHAMIFN